MIFEPMDRRAGGTTAGRWAGLVFLLAGCRSEPPARWPFPPVEAPDERAILTVLHVRTDPPPSLYAELSMSFQSRDQEGVVDAVVRYARPGRLRMTAFRGLLLSTHEVFDLVLDGERAELVLDDRDGPGGERRFSGTLPELARVHPGFRAVSLLREGMFLPGLLPEGEARVRETKGELLVESRAPSGAEVTWRLDRPTLGVRSAEVRVQGGATPIALSFPSYREVAGRYFPERFALHDAEAGVRIEGVLREIEVDPPGEDLPAGKESRT